MPVFLNSQSSNFFFDLSVREIVRAVIKRGDQALIEYTEKFDRISLPLDKLRFTQSELKAKAAEVSKNERDALELAAARIRAYHQKQLPDNAFWTDEWS